MGCMYFPLKCNKWGKKEQGPQGVFKLSWVGISTNI